MLFAYIKSSWLFCRGRTLKLKKRSWMTWEHCHSPRCCVYNYIYMGHHCTEDRFCTCNSSSATSTWVRTVDGRVTMPFLHIPQSRDLETVKNPTAWWSTERLYPRVEYATCLHCKRTIWFRIPIGVLESPEVAGLRLACRLMLLCLLAMIRSCDWLVEQPHSSVFPHFPYLKFLKRAVNKYFKIRLQRLPDSQRLFIYSKFAGFSHLIH